jgi:hypothetical protein
MTQSCLSSVLTRVFQHTLVQWRSVLWISFSIFVVTSVIYTFFGSGEEQWWNTVETRDTQIENGHVTDDQKTDKK